jgi:thioredoxin-related protein
MKTLKTKITMTIFIIPVFLFLILLTGNQNHESSGLIKSEVQHVDMKASDVILTTEENNPEYCELCSGKHSVVNNNRNQDVGNWGSMGYWVSPIESKQKPGEKLFAGM